MNLKRWGGVGLSLILLVGCSQPPRKLPPAVLLTTDLGVEADDQWALAHLLLLHEAGAIELAGIVTTHAPSLKAPAAESSAAGAIEIVRLLHPRSPPPVIAGSSSPLEAQDRTQAGVSDNAGARFIAELSRGFTPERRLAVLSIGAATDVASALLIDPGAADRIEITAMGFDRWPEGGDPWNVRNDPAAFRTILASRAPLTVAPGDLCVKSLALEEKEAEGITRGGGASGEHLREVLHSWMERQGELCRKTTGRRAWPIWDELTVAHLLGLTRAEERPRPRLSGDLTFDHTSPAGTIRWITGVDSRALWRDLRERLRQRALAESPSPDFRPAPLASPRQPSV